MPNYEALTEQFAKEVGAIFEKYHPKHYDYGYKLYRMNSYGQKQLLIGVRIGARTWKKRNVEIIEPPVAINYNYWDTYVDEDQFIEGLRREWDYRTKRS